jgi:hypothetical protein
MNVLWQNFLQVGIPIAIPIGILVYAALLVFWRRHARPYLDSIFYEQPQPARRPLDLGRIHKTGS